MIEIPHNAFHQAAISPYSRRKSVDTLVMPHRISKEERSKSIDTSSPQSNSESGTVDNLEMLKQTLIRQSSLNNLLMKKIACIPEVEKEPEEEVSENISLKAAKTSSEKDLSDVEQVL